MDSSGWIEHFYRNACAAKDKRAVIELPTEDLRSLQAVRPGQLTARSGKLLIDVAQSIARESRDGAFGWAVRLYVGEQQRQSVFIKTLLSANGKGVGRPAWYSTFSAPVLDALPTEAILLLLACRARVAASFFGALAERAASPCMRSLSERLAQEQLGELQFANFVSSRLVSKHSRVPTPLVDAARRSITVAIATRVWMRQRTRLREAGQTFAGFLAGLLDAPAIAARQL